MDLFYRQYSQNGSPLFIFHGLFGMLDNWHNVAQKLAESYAVFSVDLRNHGQSPHSAEMDYGLMADDIAQLLDTLGFEKAHLLGHSMGGKTVMTFALKYPEKVDKLIVADISTREYQRGHDEIFDAIIPLKLETFETRGDIDRALTPLLPDFGVRQFILKNLGRDEKGRFYWKMNVESIYKNYDNIIAAITSSTPYKGETLFIRGEKSKYIQDDDWKNIQQLFPNAQLGIISGAGHWVHAENPAEVVRLVSEFLK